MSKFTILMETNSEDPESWYYFIKYDGNEDALTYLDKQLNKIDMFMIDGYSIFDLDLIHLVSEETAREMCMVDLNTITPHRKFDGKLQMINLNFKKRDSNEDMIEKLFDKLGLHHIDDFIDEEDEISSDDLKDSSTEEESDGEDYLVPTPTINQIKK